MHLSYAREQVALSRQLREYFAELMTPSAGPPWRPKDRAAPGPAKIAVGVASSGTAPLIVTSSAGSVPTAGWP